jgi:hypothetical protein
MMSWGKETIIMKRYLKWLTAVLITLTWVLPPQSDCVRADDWNKGIQEVRIQKEAVQKTTTIRSLPKMQFFYNQNKIVR